MTVFDLLTQVMSLNLPMVGAVNYAKGDYLREFGISEMLATIEVSSIFSSTLIIICAGKTFCEQDNRGVDV